MKTPVHAFRRRLFAAAALLTAAACEAPGRAADSDPRPGAVADRRLAAAVLAQANQARRQSGVARLRADRALDGMAEAFSRELARRGELSHESTVSTRRTLADRLRASGAQVGASAENVARSVEAEALLPAQVIVGWMRDRRRARRSSAPSSRWPAPGRRGRTTGRGTSSRSTPPRAS